MKEYWIDVYKNILTNYQWQGKCYFDGEAILANNFDVIVLYRIHVRLK